MRRVKTSQLPRRGSKIYKPRGVKGVKAVGCKGLNPMPRAWTPSTPSTALRGAGPGSTTPLPRPWSTPLDPQGVKLEPLCLCREPMLQTTARVAAQHTRRAQSDVEDGAHVEPAWSASRSARSSNGPPSKDQQWASRERFPALILESERVGLTRGD